MAAKRKPVTPSQPKRPPARPAREKAARSTPAKAPRAAAPPTVEGYLAAVPAATRPALEALRKAIRAVVPGATEAIGYGIVVFKAPRGLVGLGATGGDAVLYLMGTKVLEAHAAELTSWRCGKGSIRFPPEKPLPAALVKKLVKARVEEERERESSRG